MSHAKAAELIEMLFGGDLGGPKETCIRWGSRCPTGRGSFGGFQPIEKRHCWTAAKNL